MSRQLYTRSKNIMATHVPASNTAAVVTLAANADNIHDIRAIYASYDSAPTGGNLLVTINAVTKLDLDVTAAGLVGGSPGLIFAFDDEEDGLHGDYNQAVVITLAAGGVGKSGTLNVLYR